MDRIKPFSEDISTGSFFDPGDLVDSPDVKIEVPKPVKPALKYMGPIKKPEEVTATDLRKAKNYLDKVDLYTQMVGATHLREAWIHEKKNHLWNDVKHTQYQGWTSEKYNKDLIKFLRKQDNEWLRYHTAQKAGITRHFVTQGLMKELGISQHEAGMKITRLRKSEWAKKLSKKDLAALKKYKAGEFLRSLSIIPAVEGFLEKTGEYYHRDVGWY